MTSESLDQSLDLYARPRHLKVFISSKITGDTLADERKSAIATVEEFPLTEPWAWERDAIAGSFYSEDECVGQAATSDAIVLILDDELTPVTQAEYEAAHRGGAHTIILLKKPSALSPTLKRFVASAQDDAITKEFSSAEQLQSHIDEALWTWTVRAGRTLIVRARKERARSGNRALLEQGELVDANGQARSLGEVIEGAEEEVAQGEATEALDLLYEIAATATDEEHLPLARLLVEELERVVPADSIDEKMRAWILNLKGRNSSDPARARIYFEHMRQIGIGLADKNLEATSLQNLGVVAVIEEDEEVAKKCLYDSFHLKLEIDENYGAAQVMLNTVNVMLSTDSLSLAEGILDSLEGALHARQGLSDLRSTVFGQRGMIESKRGNHERAKTEFKASLAQARQAKSSAREATALQNLGSNARERNQDREALRWHGKALERAQALGDRRKEVVLLSAIGTIHSQLDEWQIAAERFSEAADIADILEDGEAQSEAWGNVAACWIRLGKPEVAQRLITEALSDPKATTEPSWRATQLMNLGEVLVGLDDPESAVTRFEEAANLSPEPEQKDKALQRGAEIALAHPGLSNRAPMLLERALGIQMSVGTKADWAWRAATFGALLSDTSQNDVATTYFTKALSVFSRNGDHRRAFYTRNDRAIAKTRTGDLAGAAADLQASRILAERLRDRRLECQARSNLGEVERQRGHYSEAAKELRAGLRLAQDLKDVAAEGAALALLGLLHFSEDDLDQAEDLYKAALDIGRNQRDSKIQASALGGLGGCAYHRGRFAVAERKLQQAVRHRGDVSSDALAEDLAVLVMSQAVRNKLDEESLQQLVTVSGEIGWDSHAADQISLASRAVVEAGGEPQDAVSVHAASLMCAVRAGINPEDTPLEPGQEAFDRLIRVIMEGVYWIHRQPDPDSLLRELDEAVSEGLELPAGDNPVNTLIQQASEVWAEPDESSEGAA